MSHGRMHCCGADVDLTQFADNCGRKLVLLADSTIGCVMNHYYGITRFLALCLNSFQDGVTLIGEGPWDTVIIGFDDRLITCGLTVIRERRKQFIDSTSEILYKSFPIALKHALGEDEVLTVEPLSPKEAHRLVFKQRESFSS